MFSVGDRAQTIGKYPHTISSIEIRQKNKNRDEKDGIDRIWLNWENDCGGNWLEDTEKVKEPILTTVDGFELFGGELIYGVTDDFQLCYTSIATKENVQGVRIFAKQENAEKYIKQFENYKTVDGKQIVEGDVFYIFNKKKWRAEKSSYGNHKTQKYDGKRYRTEEEVLQKIKEEKPQYSLKYLKETIEKLNYFGTTLIKYLENDNNLNTLDCSNNFGRNNN